MWALVLYSLASWAAVSSAQEQQKEGTPAAAAAAAGAPETGDQGPLWAAAEEAVDLSQGLAGVPMTDDDVLNNERLSKWFGEAFHSALRFDPEAWDSITTDLERLADAAMTGAPSLAFAVGSALYSYFWWGDTGDGRMDVAVGERAVQLLQRSVEFQSCSDSSLNVDAFLARQCHQRWRQLMLVSAETARHLAVEALEPRRAASAHRVTNSLFKTLRQVAFFRQFEALGASLRKPHDLNYNMDYYPHVNLGPIWPKELVPLAGFLEMHFEDFMQDLRSIRDAHTFWELHMKAFVSETQFTPHDDDWQTVYLFVNQKWVPRNCEAAPRTCELLRQRPEIAGCRASSVGAGFLRLRPGARLKPHFGNGPRLSVHLGLETPEVGDIHMQVGDATVRWQAGRAVVFDDTYIHKVRHDGEAPRFVLLLWFCHPCDSDNWDNPPERQPEVCHWPR